MSTHLSGSADGEGQEVESQETTGSGTLEANRGGDLEPAARVFAEKGFTGGTTNHIAEWAGGSIGSLYQYFPDKDAIMMGLMERHLADEQIHLAE